MEVIKYTKVGEYHKKNNKKNEDVVRYKENDRFLVAVLSDGASCCEKSREGAMIICEEAVNFLIKYGEAFFKFSSDKTAYLIVEQLFYKLKTAADKSNQVVSDYAATLSFCCVDKELNRVLLFNLGDGAVFEYKHSFESAKLILGPQRYKHIYTPFITTMNGYKAVKTKVMDVEKNQLIFICSDGVLKEFNSSIDEKVKVNLEMDCSELKQKLKMANNFDDCSFIAIKI